MFSPHDSTPPRATGTASIEADFLLAGLSRERLDRDAIDALRLLDAGPAGAVSVIVEDYLAAIKLVEASCRARADEAGMFDIDAAAKEFADLEARLWIDCAAATDADGSQKIERIRQCWMRRTWLERPGQPVSFVAAGIDLAAFVRNDWFSRKVIDGNVEPSVGLQARTAEDIERIVSEYSREMSAILDDLRMRFRESCRRENQSKERDARAKMQAERFLLVCTPYKLTRRFVERVTTALASDYGTVRAVAWRDRFLSKSDPMLFGRVGELERKCLDALDDAAWRGESVPQAVLKLAEARWRGAALTHDLFVDYVSRGGGLPEVKNASMLAEMDARAIALDDAVANAAQAIHAVDGARDVGRRWQHWFPRPTESATGTTSHD